MQIKYLTTKVVRLTADEGMKLTKYFEETGDLLLYASYTCISMKAEKIGTVREITEAEDAEYIAAKEALENSLNNGGSGDGVE
jgi:hypothetical protein